MLAAMPSSCITSMSITSRVIKPIASLISAAIPATYKPLKANLAASRRFSVSASRRATAFITCTPWLTPTARTRKGTRME